MFETYTTVTGRVITEPRRNQTAAGGEVLSFRVACHSRRQDRQTGEWADGPTLFLTVTAWRRLAVGAADVVRKGSSIIAYGQLRTNEYTGSDGARRSDLEMTAVSLGLDLGQRQFDRSEQPEADRREAPEPDAATPPTDSEVTRLHPVATDGVTVAVPPAAPAGSPA